MSITPHNNPFLFLSLQVMSQRRASSVGAIDASLVVVPWRARDPCSRRVSRAHRVPSLATERHFELPAVASLISTKHAVTAIEHPPLFRSATTPHPASAASTSYTPANTESHFRSRHRFAIRRRPQPCPLRRSRFDRPQPRVHYVSLPVTAPLAASRSPSPWAA